MTQEALPYAEMVITSGVGEGLRHKNSEVIIDAAAHYGSTCLTNTNGTTFVLPRLAKMYGISRLLFSFDGALPETFNVLRKGADFWKVVRNIRVLSRANQMLPPRLRLNLEMRFTACASNMIEMPLLVELAAAIGIPTITVSTFAVSSKASPYHIELVEWYEDLYDSCLGEAKKLADLLGVKMEWEPSQRRQENLDTTQEATFMVERANPFDRSRLVPVDALLADDDFEDEARQLAEMVWQIAVARLHEVPDRAECEWIDGQINDMSQSIRILLGQGSGQNGDTNVVMLKKLRDPDAMRGSCHFLHEALYVSSGGISQPCCIYHSSAFESLTDHSVRSVFNGPGYRTLLAELYGGKPNSVCSQCPYLQWTKESDVE